MAHVLDRRTGSTSPGHALAGIVLRYFFLFKTGSRDRVGSQFSEKFVQENWFRVGAELVPVLKKVSRAGHRALRDLSADPASVVKGPAVHRLSGRALQRADLGGEVADPRGNGGALDAARSFCAGRVRLFASASGWQLSDLWQRPSTAKIRFVEYLSPSPCRPWNCIIPAPCPGSRIGARAATGARSRSGWQIVIVWRKLRHLLA